MGQYLFFFLFFSFLWGASWSKGIVDCKVVVGGISECNPYGTKLIQAKQIKYNRDRKPPIVFKTMPVPEKFHMQIVSVQDLIDRYITINAPTRYSLPLKEHFEKEGKKAISIKKNHTGIKKKKKVKKIFVRYGKYKVVKGDTFSSIAKKFFMEKKELLRVNLMDKDSILKIGQTLRIPFEQKIIDAIVNGVYTIESGDTLHSIAKQFKIDAERLAILNNINTKTLIKVGNKLKLPFGKSQKKVSTVKSNSLKRVAKRVKEKKRKSIKKLQIFGRKSLRVTATAYSSHKSQTDSTPFLAAWNNRLRPGMKIIAVSRDLLTRYGMKNGTKVRIGGLPGYYTVRDKMNKRYSKRIDIYMGLDRRRALRWGRRNVMIYW